MPISGKEMIRRYLKAGRKVLRQNGSHVILGLGNKRETIPVHGNKEFKIRWGPTCFTISK